MNKDLKHSEYKQGKAAASLPQYVALIKEDLLPRLIKEDDPEKRKALGKIVTDRLHNLNNILRPIVLAKEQNKRTLLNIITANKKSQKNGFLLKPSPDFNLLKEDGLKGWLDYELQLDKELTTTMRKHVEVLETEKQMLREALSRREVIKEEVESENRHGHGTKEGRPESGASSMQERISMLETLVKKQDDEVHILQRQLDEEHLQFVHILKDDYEEMMHHLKPCAKRLSEYYDMTNEKMHGSKSPKGKKSLGKSLKHNVSILVELMDKMRDRVEQTTDVLKDIEKEKEVCLQLLNKNDSYILSKVLSEKLQQWKDDKHYLNEEIKSLRKNIEVLAEQNKCLMAELEKANNIENKAEDVKPKIMPRVRRSSAPLSAKTSVKSHEKKSSVVSVGVQPKIINFGDTGQTVVPNKSTRNKSSLSIPFRH